MNSVVAFASRHCAALGLILCLSLASAFALYRLTESPRTWYDEGMFVGVAKEVSRGNGFTLRVAPDQVIPAGWFTTVGYPVIYPVAGAFRLFGEGMVQARVTMAFFLLLAMLASYGYVLATQGEGLAIAAALLLVTFAPVYGNGKNVLGEVPGMAFFFVGLWALHQIEQGKKHIGWYAVLGLSMGFFAASKPNFLILIPLLLLPAWLLRKRMQKTGVILSATAIITCVALFFFFQYPSAAEAWTAFVGYVRQPGLADVTHLPYGQMVVQNVLRFVHEAAPAYLLLVLLPWVVTLVLRHRRTRDVPASEWFAFAFTIATLLYFVRGPGFYRYLLPAQLLGFVFLPRSVATLVRMLPPRYEAAATRFALALCAVVILFQTYQVLFSSWVATYYPSHRTAELVAFDKAEAGAGRSVFFVHALDAAALMQGTNYFQYFYADLYRRWVGDADALGRGVADTVLVKDEMMVQVSPLLGAYVRDGSLDSGAYVVFRKASWP